MSLNSILLHVHEEESRRKESQVVMVGPDGDD